MAHPQIDAARDVPVGAPPEAVAAALAPLRALGRGADRTLRQQDVARAGRGRRRRPRTANGSSAFPENFPDITGA
jgi:hypothetical protein